MRFAVRVTLGVGSGLAPETVGGASVGGDCAGVGSEAGVRAGVGVAGAVTGEFVMVGVGTAVVPGAVSSTNGEPAITGGCAAPNPAQATAKPPTARPASVAFNPVWRSLPKPRLVDVTSFITPVMARSTPKVSRAYSAAS